MTGHEIVLHPSNLDNFWYYSYGPRRKSLNNLVAKKLSRILGFVSKREPNALASGDQGQIHANWSPKASAYGSHLASLF